MARHKDSLEVYLPQAAFFSCAPKALTATITARVVSCGDAFVGRYLGTSARSFTYPRRNAWKPSKHSRKRCPVATVFSPRADRNRSRVAIWLRSIGLVVSPLARYNPVRMGHALGSAVATAVIEGRG